VASKKDKRKPQNKKTDSDVDESIVARAPSAPGSDAKPSGFMLDMRNGTYEADDKDETLEEWIVRIAVRDILTEKQSKQKKRKSTKKRQAKRGKAKAKRSKARKTTYTTQKGRSPTKTKKGKNCAAGNRWARERYKKPSMYRSMAAAKYCKNMSKRKKKNESLNIIDDLIEEVMFEDFVTNTLMEKKKNPYSAQQKWLDQKWETKDKETCGTASTNPKTGKKRATKQCYPRKKWSQMSKSQQRSSNAKKTAGSRKGKRVVQGTKASKKISSQKSS
jgi:hypothetical protein